MFRRSLVTMLVVAAACSGADGDNRADPMATRGEVASSPDHEPSPTSAAEQAALEPADGMPPSPDRPIPRRADGMVTAIVELERSLRADIERWRRGGAYPNEPSARAVRLRVLYQQRITRELANRRRLSRLVLPALPRGMRSFYAANVRAARAVGSLVSPVEKLPNFHYARPASPEVLMRFYRRGQREFRIPVHVLAAVNFVESKFGRVLGPSSAGALGPMQFLPSTWDAYGGGGDILDPRDAIIGAARYLDASGAPERMRDALFAYNRSDAYVDAILIYARQIQANPTRFFHYYWWQVFVSTQEGVVQMTGPGSPRPHL